MTRRRSAVVAGSALAVLLVLELAAVPFATPILSAAVARCVEHERLEVMAVDRPVLPKLLLGRVSGVELRAEGVTVDELRIDRAHLDLPDAVLPWAISAPEPAPATLSLRVTAVDLEAAVRSRMPLGLPVRVRLERGLVVLGAPGVPVELELAVDLAPDGTVRVRPQGGSDLLERLGIGQRFVPAAGAQVLAVDIGDDEVTGRVALDVVPGLGDGGACAPPLAGSGSRTVHVAAVSA